MEKDLDFLIKALSLPNSPLWSDYSEAQLSDMRESFISLKHVLEQNQFNIHETSSNLVRFKAGGTTATNQAPLDEPFTVLPDEYRFRNHMPPSLTSLSSSSLSEDYETTNDDDDDKQEKARQGDDETSTTDNFLALVPYEKDEPSTELVRYEPWLETVDDDSYDTDTDTLCGSSSTESVSCSGARSMATSSGGGISISIPMQMEYVWNNSDYKADSTDSDMTIIADGFNYVLSS